MLFLSMMAAVVPTYDSESTFHPSWVHTLSFSFSVKDDHDNSVFLMSSVVNVATPAHQNHYSIKTRLGASRKSRDLPLHNPYHCIRGRSVSS